MLENKKPLCADTHNGFYRGASEKTRTFDLLITNQLHYRLCYTSIPLDFHILSLKYEFVK